MAMIDPRRMALRLKVVEALRRYTEHRQAQESGRYWRRLILPN